MIAIIVVLTLMIYASYLVGRHHGANHIYDKFIGAFDENPGVDEEELNELMATIGVEPLDLEKELDKLITNEDASLSSITHDEEIDAICVSCGAKLHLDLAGYPVTYFENYETLINELEYQRIDHITCDCGIAHTIDSLLEIINEV